MFIIIIEHHGSDEQKDRVDDALHATRAAVEEGVVAGGGVALVRAVQALDNLTGINDDQTAGVNILRRAIEAPLRQIVANAGDEPSVVINAVKLGEGNYGYNAATGQVEILPMMYLALSYDHRLIDGKEAVQFLVTIKELLEEPAKLILDL